MSAEYHFHTVNVMEQVDRMMRNQKALKSTPREIAGHVAEMASGYEMFNRQRGEFEKAVHWQFVADYAWERARG